MSKPKDETVKCSSCGRESCRCCSEPQAADQKRHEENERQKDNHGSKESRE